jgi:hypothetical protein
MNIKSALKSHLTVLTLSMCIFSISSEYIIARDYNVNGRVTDSKGKAVAMAKVSMTAGTSEFAAFTSSDGTYSMRISGIYDKISGLLETGIPFPNPFSNSVNIPFIINSSGDVRLTIYSLSGKKIKEVFFDHVESGSYRIIWDGCDQNGASQWSGFYVYTISFKGSYKSGKLIKVSGGPTYSTGTSLVPAMMPPLTPVVSGNIRFQVITGVTSKDYYPVRLTDITIGRDTSINFELAQKQVLPFKTSGNHIAMYTGTEYRPLILKGINLGSSPPGYFPGEIAYAITPEMYKKWISMIARAGFNGIRVYTLHPPAFYEKLAEYNERNPKNPLLLFQGIWLEEMDDPGNPASYDLTNRIGSFTNEIHESINCIHGKGDIAFRSGKVYGRYLTDVSRWTAGYIIGREISQQEVTSTDTFHPELNSFSGNEFSITGATATEVFATRMLDESVSFEARNYSVRRPVSISSWPTLDPLNHPTEVLSNEDKASFDIAKISGKNLEAGIFACYHAYPYFPNFISQQSSYQSFSDSQGPNSYLGYLTDLKNHYSGIPLVIGEFGVPSSWGSAHQSFSNMNHGGYSEQQQGEKDIRMLHNIVDAGCAGGFMFSWMDEWFKPTWIVLYLEAFGFLSDNAVIPTRQLWHNLTSPEQNFGLITFEQTETDPFISYQTDKPSGPVRQIEATNDNSCFYLDIDAAGEVIPGDTMMIAFDTYLSGTGESQLPNGKLLNNRSEFLLTMVFGNDTALHHVTAAYDLNGFTPRFNRTDPAIQKYKSTVTNGAPWKEMQWYTDAFEPAKSMIGRLPMEKAADFTPGQRSAVAWNGHTIKVRIPWTMLYFYDPTHMKVINGAVTHDGGLSFEILSDLSDGIALSLYYKGMVTNTTSRYSWLSWLVAPATYAKEKKSLQVIETGLLGFPYFAD